MNDFSVSDLDRGIVLVGLMGAGKSSVGRRLAKRLGLSFYDADSEIEKAADCTIAEIFERHGEAAFRDGERRVIARLLDGPPHILATGGGAFMDEVTRAAIRDKGISIWLRADLEILLERVKRRDNRPLLKQGNPEDILRALMAERDPVYAQADLTITSSQGPHEDVVEQIVLALGGHLADRVAGQVS
jgi:shikimate kinase